MYTHWDTLLAEDLGFISILNKSNFDDHSSADGLFFSEISLLHNMKAHGTTAPQEEA